MQAALPSAWAFWSAAIAVGSLGAVLFIWALLWDRPRGRRRCPKCSYDMSQTDATTCPECGRDARLERNLFRTRRRWKWAALALFAITAAVALALVPYVRSPVWWRFAPTAVLIPRILPADGTPADAIEGEVAVRLQNTQVPAWQQRRIASRAASHLGRHASAVERTRALRLLQGIGPDGVGALPAVVPLLDDADEVVRILAWGTLAHIGVRDSDAVRRLNALLTDPSGNAILRQRVTNRLGDNGPESAPMIASLVRIIEDPALHQDNRGFIIGGAAYTLGAMGPAARQALPSLRALAANTEQPLQRRYTATHAIARINAEAGTEAAYHAGRLTDPDVEIRRMASTFLIDYDISRDGLEAIPALLRALQDTDPEVQQNAKVALAAMIHEDPRSLKSLRRIASGADKAMAALAAETITRGGQSTAVGFAAPPPAPPPPTPAGK